MNGSRRRSKTAPPIIVGAGPTGLSAALLLAQNGITSRIYEQRAERSPLSKAFAINARTLTLLEPTGVTAELLRSGRKTEFGNIYYHGRRLFRFDMSRAQSKYPFLLIFAQSETERVLADALSARGINVERECMLTELLTAPDAVTLTFARPNEVTFETTASQVFAADGAHSAIRHHLGIDFAGSTLPEKWGLYDLHLKTSLAPDEAHIFLFDDGGMFVLRLHDDIWRVIGFAKDPLDRLPIGTVPGEIVWHSDFTISHRVAATFQQGRICLGGDAAHIHSPLGGRGMNLGIEDAYVYATLLAQGRLENYDRVRQAVVVPLVRRIATMTEIPRNKTLLAHAVRWFAPLLAGLAPLAESTLRRFATGADHEVKLE